MTVLSHHTTTYGEQSEAAIEAASAPMREAEILYRLAELSETMPALDAARIVFHGDA